MKSSVVASLLSILLLAHGLPTAAETTRPLNLYISPNGNDAAAGTVAEPLATLEGARDAIRQLRLEGPLESGVNVWLRGGTYAVRQSFVLAERDSGTAAAPIVYRACQGEDVTLLGGRELPVESCGPVTDPNFLNRIIDPTARDRIVQIDLASLGLTDYGKLARRGFVVGSPLPPMELFVDGRWYIASVEWPRRGVSIAPLVWE